VIFEILNAIHLGLIATTNTPLFNAEEIPVPAKLGEVVEVSFLQSGWSDCRFKGVMTPYERDWTETVREHDGTERTIPPDPGKIEAWAILINKKECPGKSVEPMLRYAVRTPVLFNKTKMLKHYPIKSFSLVGLKEELRPKWLPQVQSAVESSADTNPVSKAFVDFIPEIEKAAKQTAREEQSGERFQ
jgi:hypothetical protein